MRRPLSQRWRRARFCHRGGAVGRAVAQIAEVDELDGSGVTGSVEFVDLGDAVEVRYNLSGLTPGEHGFHLHQTGACGPDSTGTPAGAAGGHFNPLSSEHGAPSAAPAQRHAGDLGNILAEATGQALGVRIDSVLSFEGPTAILGKAVLVHGGTDDLTSQPSGDAGPRVGCGVVRALSAESEAREDAPVVGIEVRCASGLPRLSAEPSTPSSGQPSSTASWPALLHAQPARPLDEYCDWRGQCPQLRSLLTLRPRRARLRVPVGEWISGPSVGVAGSGGIDRYVRTCVPLGEDGQPRSIWVQGAGSPSVLMSCRPTPPLCNDSPIPVSPPACRFLSRVRVVGV